MQTKPLDTSEAGRSAPDAQVKLGAVILAAGNSSRMGRPKMLLPWGRETVISHHVRTWERLEAVEIAVVIRDCDEAIPGELAKRNLQHIRQIVNASAEGDMFTSVQCAARWSGWTPALTHWAIILGDQPHLSESILRRVLSALAPDNDKIVQPSRAGRPRHPVFLCAAAFLALRDTPVTTLKDFLSTGNWPVQLVEMDDDALDWDLNTLHDYERMLAKFSPAAPREPNQI